MAIKFEDKPQRTPRDGAKSDLRARFATPIEADDPVNPDVASDKGFAEPPDAETMARTPKPKRKKR